MHEFGSLAGHWTAFALFSTIAVVCGYAVARIARGLAAPPGQLPYIGTTPRARRIAGTLLATALLAIIWQWLWSGFHRLALTGASVVLEYEVPSRQRTLAASDVASVTWQPGPRSSRVLVLTTQDGARYRSMQSSLPDAQERAVLEDIRDRLATGRMFDDLRE